MAAAAAVAVATAATAAAAAVVATAAVEAKGVVKEEAREASVMTAVANTAAVVSAGRAATEIAGDGSDNVPSAATMLTFEHIPTPTATAAASGAASGERPAGQAALQAKVRAGLAAKKGKISGVGRGGAHLEPEPELEPELEPGELVAEPLLPPHSEVQDIETTGEMRVDGGGGGECDPVPQGDIPGRSSWTCAPVMTAGQGTSYAIASSATIVAAPTPAAPASEAATATVAGGKRKKSKSVTSAAAAAAGPPAVIKPARVISKAIPSKELERWNAVKAQRDREDARSAAALSGGATDSNAVALRRQIEVEEW